jgi:hypothetical protein
MKYKVAVQMARGGFVDLLVCGNISNDSDGAGRKFTTIEIESIRWPRGGVVKEKNIASLEQVKDVFYEMAEKDRDDR